MTSGPGEPDRPFAGKGCPKCGYDLTGTVETRCPECGAAFNPAELRPVGTRRKVRWRMTILCVLLATYLPNTWVFWIDYPWNSYRVQWIMLFPLLPSLFPGTWIAHWTGLTRHYEEPGMFVLTGCLTLVCVIVGVLLARRSRRWLIGVCIVMLGFQVFNAYVGHALFRM